MPLGEVRQNFLDFEQMHVEVIAEVNAILGINERANGIARYPASNASLFHRFARGCGARRLPCLYTPLWYSPAAVAAARDEQDFRKAIC
ncbi:hypothetical protein D9M70_594030 [compost metagenome]